MSTKPNSTTVGLFIVTGLALVVTAIILFGSHRWFSPTITLIVYFEDSVKGLDAGSPVTFKGVRIGQVKEVLIHQNQASNDLNSPVLIELSAKTLQSKMDLRLIPADRTELKAEIDKGLRAQLAVESYLTSRLYVELDVFPDAGPPVFHQLKPVYLEIPSRPTRLAEIMKSLGQIDVVGIANKLESLLTKLDSAVGDVQFKEINDSLVRALKRLDEVAGSLEVRETLASLRQTLDEIYKLAAHVDTRIDPVSQNAVRTLEEANQTLVQIRSAAEELRDMVATRSSLRTELDATLVDLSNAAESVSALADFLRRNPQALVSGRKLPLPAK